MHIQVHMYEPLSVLLLLRLFPIGLRHWALLARGRWDSMNKTRLCRMRLLSVFWAWRLRHLRTKSPSTRPLLPQPCGEHTSPKKMNLRVTTRRTRAIPSWCHCLGCLPPLMPVLRALGFHRGLGDQERGHPRKEIQT